MTWITLSVAALVTGIAVYPAHAQWQVFPPTTVGDRGPAVQAEIDGPMHVAVDNSGNVYVYQQADVYQGFNHRGQVLGSIRRIDSSTHKIKTVLVECRPGGKLPKTACIDGIVSQIRIDPLGRVLLAEFIAHRLRSLNPKTGKLSLIAGNGNSRFDGDGGPATQAAIFPKDFDIDGMDNIFIADSNNLIRRVDARTGIISTVAGGGSRRASSGDGGPATSADLGAPDYLAVDRDGNIFVTANLNDRIRRISAATGVIETIAGTSDFQPGHQELIGENGPALEAHIHPAELAIDPMGNVLFRMVGRICRIDRITGIVSTIAGTGEKGFSGDGGPATRALIAPEGIAVDRDGNIFFAEYENNRIRRVDGTTGIITYLRGEWTASPRSTPRS